MTTDTTPAPSLRATYRCLSVPYQLGAHVSRTTMYDAAIRRGVEIVWQEGREPGRLCLTSGAATRRAQKVLRQALEAPWS